MARQNITEKIWYDPEGTNSIMLDVTEEIPSMDPTIVDGVELLPKDEYHCTLVAAGKLSQDQDIVLKIIEDVTAYLQFDPNTVRFMNLTDSYFVCRDGEKVTLIAGANLVGLNGLRKIVQQTVPDYAPIVPHVTLLKNENTQYGIGINSAEDLKKLCRKVDIYAL